MFTSVTEPEEASPDEEPSLDGPIGYAQLYKGSGMGERADPAPGRRTGRRRSGQLPRASWVDFDLESIPVFPNLKLWVVPGRARGESEAWMVAYLDNDPQTAPARYHPGCKGGIPWRGKLLTPDGEAVSSVITGPEGTEQVYLFYSGLDWSNYREAVFKVQPASPTGPATRKRGKSATLSVLAKMSGACCRT